MTETTSQLHAHSLRLTIRIGSDAVLFAISNPLGKQKIVHEKLTLNRSISTAANFRNMATRSELLRSGYSRALVLVDTDVMMVPLDEYPNEDMGTLYHSCFTGHAGEELLTNVLPELKAVAVFPINKDLKGVLAEQFTDLAFMPVAQPIWTHLYRRNFSTPRKKLFAYFHDHRMEVFSYAQNRLQFCNCFDGSHEHDALYFLLYAWRQLGFDGEKDELLAAGDIPQREWLTERVHQYVRRFTILNPAADFGASSTSLNPQLPYDLKAVLLGRK